MNAEQMAKRIDLVGISTPKEFVATAAMLRKQAEAIRKLRDAMNDIATCSHDLGAIECANEALAATEEFK